MLLSAVVGELPNKSSGGVPEVLADVRGPMARMRALEKDEGAAEEILKAVERGLRLEAIAREWGVPKRDFLFYVAANGELSERCRRVRELAGVDLRLEGMEILDGASVEDIAVAKERAGYRERLSKSLNRPLFGESVKMEHGGTVVVDAALLGFAGELLALVAAKTPERIENVIEHEPGQAPDSQVGTDAPPSSGALPAPAAAKWEI